MSIRSAGWENQRQEIAFWFFCIDAKLRDLRISKSLQSQKQQTISRRFPLLFPWLSILRTKLDDAGREAVHFGKVSGETCHLVVIMIIYPQ